VLTVCVPHTKLLVETAFLTGLLDTSAQRHRRQGSRLQGRLSHACSCVSTWRGVASQTDRFLYRFRTLNVKCPLADIPWTSLYKMKRPSGMDFTRWGKDNVFIDVAYTPGLQQLQRRRDAQTEMPVCGP
jgi:hypothetical protein